MQSYYVLIWPNIYWKTQIKELIWSHLLVQHHPGQQGGLQWTDYQLSICWSFLNCLSIHLFSTIAKTICFQIQRSSFVWLVDSLKLWWRNSPVTKPLSYQYRDPASWHGQILNLTFCPNNAWKCRTFRPVCVQEAVWVKQQRRQWTETMTSLKHHSDVGLHPKSGRSWLRIWYGSVPHLGCNTARTSVGRQILA